jgi:hypothetical protein
LIWIPFIAAAVWLFHLLIDRKTSSKTYDGSVSAFLRHIDLSTLESLFDPKEESRLREELPARAFRRLQRSRIMAAREMIRNIRHNAGVLMRWASEEEDSLQDKNRSQFDQKDHLVIDVVRAAGEVRRGASFALAKMLFWRMSLVHLWVCLPSPSLSDFREVAGRDMLRDYESLTGSVAQLMLAHSEKHYEAVRASM